MLMLKVLVIFSLLLVCSSKNYVFTIPQCRNGALDLVDNQPVSLTCTGLTVSHNIYWSLDAAPSGGGADRRLGNCRVCRSSCPSCSDVTTGYSMSRTRSNTTLSFTGSRQLHNGARIRCSSFNNRSQVDCTLNVLKVYSLPQCRGGVVDVLETMNTTILCEGLTSGHNMNWTITDANGGVSRIAWCYSCSACENKCSIQDDDFVVTRTSTQSSLTFVSNVRQKAGGILNCSRMDTRLSDECHIRVVYPGVLHQPSVTLHSNWTVSLHAAVDKVFASDSSITCQWNSSRGNQTERLPATNATLSPYTESDGVSHYYRGTCDTLLSLNTSEGSYNFSVEILPGHGPVSLGSALVEMPGPLTLDTLTCPEYTGEGRDVSCRCSHPSTQGGSPPATLAWPPAADSATLHVEAVKRGDPDSAALHMEAVKRGQNGTVRTCLSVWGSQDEVVQSLNYTLLVAHGPNGVTVTGPTNVTGDLQNLTLTCTFTEVYPSANFTWNIPCATLNSTADVSTCTLDGGLLEDGTTAVCLVFNSAVPELKATDSYKFPVTGRRQEGRETSVAAVAGGVVAAVVAVVVVVAVVLVVRRRNAPHKVAKNTEQIGPPSNGEPAVAVSSCTDAGPYDSLAVSEIGLKSEYSQLGHHGNSLEPSKVPTGPYESLQMSDVGLASPYTQIGHRGNSSVASSDGVYCNT